MRILYVLGLQHNPLYEGQFALFGKYQTSGQLTYLFDFVHGVVTTGHQITVVCDAPEAIPPELAISAQRLSSSMEGDYDLALVDTSNIQHLDMLNSGIPSFYVVHNALSRIPSEFIRYCHGFLCMSEFSRERQRKYIPDTRIFLVPQGIDLQRFIPDCDGIQQAADVGRILVYGRLDNSRFPAIYLLLEHLIPLAYEITVLGDGPLFWDIYERFANSVILMRFVAYRSMRMFLNSFDLIISSGRGAMEGLACGIPTLCAGFEYGGAVQFQTVDRLARTNFTGLGIGRPLENLRHDIELARAIPPVCHRALARSYFDVTNSVRLFISLVESASTSHLS